MLSAHSAMSWLKSVKASWRFSRPFTSFFRNRRGPLRSWTYHQPSNLRKNGFSGIGEPSDSGHLERVGEPNGSPSLHPPERQLRGVLQFSAANRPFSGENKKAAGVAVTLG